MSLVPTLEVFFLAGADTVASCPLEPSKQGSHGGCLSLPRLCGQRSQMVLTSLEGDLGP